jgi:hypothetical protein
MAVRKICKQKRCRVSPRCEHPWWFDVMHGGRRWRMRVDDFARAARPSRSRRNRQQSTYGNRSSSAKLLRVAIRGSRRRRPYRPSR